MTQAPETPVRLLLADDHRMLREGLRRSMEAAGFEVVGEAADGAEAVELVDQLHPRVVLLDVSMPVLDGVEAARQIHRAHPDTQVVMLTMHTDPDIVRHALAAGAVGYLVKDCSTDEVIRTVELAASGDAVLSAEMAGSMLTEVQRLAAPLPSGVPATAEAGEPLVGGAPAGEPIISKREEEVLQLVAQGFSTAEVAEKLFISLKTVKNHLASIYAKLDSRDRTQAVITAVKMGIIRLE